MTNKERNFNRMQEIFNSNDFYTKCGWWSLVSLFVPKYGRESRNAEISDTAFFCLREKKKGGLEFSCIHNDSFSKMKFKMKQTQWKIFQHWIKVIITNLKKETIIRIRFSLKFISDPIVNMNLEIFLHVRNTFAT